jgi:hypothetical protein
MDRELILGVPGPWKDRSDFLSRVVKSTRGEFMFLGNLLANPKAKDHVEVELYDVDPDLRTAFEYAGQGKIQPGTLDAISAHTLTAYLHFPVAVAGQQQRLRRFTDLMRQIGGFAVKIESSGVAHEWTEWEAILGSENPFDLYRGFVTLVGDDDRYYSCGMHHFDLPESQVSRSLDNVEAADLLNRFNYYRIMESPELEEGHTFSLSEDSPRYRLELVPDRRHPEDHPFHNEHGVWDLVAVEQPAASSRKGARH